MRSSRQSLFSVSIDGQETLASPGLTVAAVLLATGRRAFGSAPGRGRPRGVYCGMGTCFDCTVKINGLERQRACVTLIAPGMEIVTALREQDATDTTP
jgi:predicted molibdopterin-dependent oxidoreductase YjgC